MIPESVFQNIQILIKVLLFHNTVTDAATIMNICPFSYLKEKKTHFV